MLKNECLFCDEKNTKQHRVFATNPFFYARWDNFPVNKGHAEIVPKRHVSSLSELTKKEWGALFDFLKMVKQFIDNMYHPDGYNVGINEGEAAGQTILHLHIHIIPRYKGDVENPRGGVRNIKKPLVEY